MRHESARILAALVLCSAVATPGTLSTQSDRPAELSSSVGDGFTIAVVGDVIIAHSLEHMMSNPAFAEVASLLQSVDVATGNLETQIIDGRTFVGSRGGYRGAGIPEQEHLDTNPSIADYLPVFAKAAIDNGADLFQGTGVHVLRGIEIYKNRPIFYGLGEFIRQRDIGRLAGRGDPTRDECPGCPFPAKYESIVAVSEFSGDRLVEVRLYPVELRYDSERLAHRGIPETASPETDRRILERLRELSAPLGTTIVIEDGVGVIRR